MPPGSMFANLGTATVITEHRGVYFGAAGTSLGRGLIGKLRTAAAWRGSSL